MQRPKFVEGKDHDSPEVQYLLKNIKLEELLPKARDAVNLFFLNIKALPEDAEQLSDGALLRPIWRAIAKKQDLLEQGGMKSVVALLTSQTLALQMQAAKALAALAADAQESLLEALRALNVHITAVKMIAASVPPELLTRLLDLLLQLANTESTRMPLMRIKTVAALVSVLDSPAKNLETEQLCYAIIAALAEQPATFEGIAKEKGLDRAVTAIVAPDPATRYAAAKVVSRFARHAGKGRDAVLQTNAVPHLFRLLVDYSPMLSEEGLSMVVGCLSHLAEDPQGANQIKEAGFIPLLVEYVLQGRAIEEKALKALLNLSVCDALKPAIIQSGILARLFHQATKESANIKILASSIMSNLATEGAFLREIGVRGIVALANTMPPAPILVQRIIARIVKATARSDDVKNGLVEHAALSIFTGIMNATKDDFVLAEIVDLLAILTKHDRIRKVIIACGHTARIVALLGSHLFERLELPIVAVVSNLTLEPAGVEAVLRLQGAFRVFANFAIWHENQELRAHALMAVANLLVHDSLRSEFVALGGLDAAIYLLYERDNPNIQASVIYVCARLAKSPEFREKLVEQDIVEHLKEVKKQPSFSNPVSSPLVDAFRELVQALKAGGANMNASKSKDDVWLRVKKADYGRSIKAPTDITLDNLVIMIKTAFRIRDDQKLSLMFKDEGYPVVLKTSDELLLLFMNYQDNKKLDLMVYEGDIPEADLFVEKPAAPPPPAPPPPPPGALEKRKNMANPFAAPAYLKTHELGMTKMSVKPQNSLLPETLMSDILSAVKKRGEGKLPLNTALVNSRPTFSTNNNEQPEFVSKPLKSTNLQNGSEEKMGEREWFRHVGRWYRGVHQIFTVHPIVVRVVFDIVESRQDHRSFTKCYDTAITNMPHVLPHMRGNALSQDEFADSLLRIGFNVKSSKGAADSTLYEFIVRPTSLTPELLLKAILLHTNAYK